MIGGKCFERGKANSMVSRGEDVVAQQQIRGHQVA